MDTQTNWVILIAFKIVSASIAFITRCRPVDPCGRLEAFGVLIRNAGKGLSA
jgi:hypothetical protein